MRSRTTSGIPMGVVGVPVTASPENTRLHLAMPPALNWVPLNVLGMYHFLTGSR